MLSTLVAVVLACQAGGFPQAPAVADPLLVLPPPVASPSARMFDAPPVRPAYAPTYPAPVYYQPRPFYQYTYPYYYAYPYAPRYRASPCPGGVCPRR